MAAKNGAITRINAVVGVWFFSNTMFPTLKSDIFGSLMGGGHLSLAILRLSTAIMSISCMASRGILHFSSPIYLSFGNSNLKQCWHESVTSKHEIKCGFSWRRR